MNITAHDNSMRTMTTELAGVSMNAANAMRSQRFEALLQGAAVDPNDAKARDTAEQLVAITLVQPLLEAAQNDPFASEMFHGGQAEKIFQQQINAIIGPRITQQGNFPVVDAVYRGMIKHSPARQGGQPSTPGQRINTHG